MLHKVNSYSITHKKRPQPSGRELRRMIRYKRGFDVRPKTNQES